MRRTVPLPALAAVVISAVPALAAAQGSYPAGADTYQGPAPAHVAVVDGRASLEREGRVDTAPLSAPLLSGDRLRTEDGRVEVLFADGSTLHLDNATTVDLQSDELLRLIDGRVRLNITRTTSAAVNYRLDSPVGSVRISQPGEYRVALLRDQGETQLELAVVRGAAEIFTDQGSTPVRAGERAYSSAGLAPSYAYPYNSAQWDGFDQWSEARRSESLGESAQYLPADIRSYSSVLDEYGNWGYAPSYGYVWYPHVAAGWRPYYYGRWVSYPRYGWTWVGVEHFAWPTHHYGRWGYNAGVWFWIPGAAWGPAYVSWAYAPGYVSWCPLGFDNRALFAINVNFGSRYYSPWHGWTVVGRSYFGHGYVHQRAVSFDRGGRGTHPAFQIRHAPPGAPDVAVPRSAFARSGGPANGDAGRVAGPGPSRGAPLTGPARSAGPTVPRYVNRGDDIIRSQTARPHAPQADIATERGGPPSTQTRPGGVPRGYAAPGESAVTRGYAPQPMPSTRADRAAEPQRTMPVRPGVPADGRERAMERGVSPGVYPQSPVYGVPRSSPGISGGPGRVEGRPYAPSARPMPGVPRYDGPRPGPGGGPAPMERATPRPSGGPQGGVQRAAPAPSPQRAAPSGPAPSAPRAVPRGGRGGR